jgi:hypothetical protein
VQIDIPDPITVPSTVADRRHEVTTFALTAGPVAAAFVLAGLGGPFDRPVLCPLRVMFGVPCPFCGLTTSFVDTAAGRLADGFAASPLGPLAFVAFVVVAAVTAMSLVRRRRVRLPSVRAGRWWEWSWVPIVLAMWVYQLTAGPWQVR